MNETISDQPGFGALLNEYQRMKKSAFVYTFVPLVGFLIAAGFLVAGALSGSLREFVPALLLAFLISGCVLPLVITARRERDLRLRVYEGGVSYRANGRETPIAWNAVEDYLEQITIKSVNGIPAGTFYRYTIRARDSATIKTSERLGDLASFSRTLHEKLFPRLFAAALACYRAGEAVTFGEIVLSRDGITIGQRKHAAWEQLTGMQVADGHLRLFTAGRETAWAAVPAGRIPNFAVLTALLEDITGSQLG